MGLMNQRVMVAKLFLHACLCYFVLNLICDQFCKNDCVKTEVPTELWLERNFAERRGWGKVQRVQGDQAGRDSANSCREQSSKKKLAGLW